MPTVKLIDSQHLMDENTGVWRITRLRQPSVRNYAGQNVTLENSDYNLDEFGDNEAVDRFHNDIQTRRSMVIHQCRMQGP